MTSTTLQLSEPYGKVAVHSSGAGEPLVLIHGVGMQSAAWTPQIKEFSKTHRVISLDMPGHGGSDPLNAEAQLPDFVAWLHVVLLALDLGPVSLAGHSMGALVSGGYAASHPEMVVRVALLNGVYLRSEEARKAVLTRAEEISGGVIDLKAPLSRWFSDNDIDKIARGQVANWLSQMNPNGYATAYGAFARGDATYADKLGQIACPFLALTSDGDLNSNAEMSRTMAKSVQNGTAVVIEDHRHMVNLTAPEQVNSALRNWLNTPINGGSND